MESPRALGTRGLVDADALLGGRVVVRAEVRHDRVAVIHNSRLAVARSVVAHHRRTADFHLCFPPKIEVGVALPDATGKCAI